MPSTTQRLEITVELTTGPRNNRSLSIRSKNGNKTRIVTNGLVLSPGTKRVGLNLELDPKELMVALMEVK
jgi:hypothetical protein